MTFTIDAVVFEGAPMRLPKEAAIAVHEIAGATSAYTQYVGMMTQEYTVEAIVETADRALLAALLLTTTHTFTDSITGLAAITVWLRRYEEQILAPGVYAITLTLQAAPV